MMDMKTRPDTWAELDTVFNTCTNIGSAQDIEYLYEHLSNGYLYMSMTDYPYPANFLEPMPAWPVSECVKPFESIPVLSEIEETMQEFKEVPKVKDSQSVFPSNDSITRKLKETTSSLVGGMSDRENLVLTAL